MRKILLLVFCTGLMVSTATGAPLLIEKAGNYLATGEMEMGLNNITYSNDKTEFKGMDLERKNSQILIPLFLRYTLNEDMEFSISVPYRSQTVEKTGGGESNSETASGLGNTSLSGKYSLMLDELALGGNLELGLPTGGKDFKQGVDMFPSVSARKGLGPFTVNANVGYKITGPYERDDDEETEANEGNIISLSAGTEYSYMKNLSFAAEFLYENLSKSEIDGEEVEGTDGSRSEIMCGLRFNQGDYRTKLGLGISLGEETYREYDYRILAGITYRL
ncbi:MAG: transporter [Elusimicrobiota bacterium]